NHRRPAAHSKSDFPRKHRLKQLRRSPDIDQVDFEAMFFEIASVVCRPYPSHGSTHGGVGGPDSAFLSVANRGAEKENRNQKTHAQSFLELLWTSYKPRKKTNT